MENTSKFKIAQLMSSLRGFFFPPINMSLITEKEAILQAIQTIKDGKLAEPAKNSLSALISPIPGLAAKVLPAHGRIHSLSVQPRGKMFMSVSPPPSPE